MVGQNCKRTKTDKKGTKLQNVHLLGFHADSSWAHINCQPHTWMDNRFTLPLWGCVRLRTNPCFPGSPNGRRLVFVTETNAPTVPECNNSCVHHKEGLSRGCEMEQRPGPPLRGWWRVIRVQSQVRMNACGYLKFGGDCFQSVTASSGTSA